MKLASLALAVLTVASATTAIASEITLTSNAPAKIEYQMVQQLNNLPPVYGATQTMTVDKIAKLAVAVPPIGTAGIVVLAMNGQQIPGKFRQYNSEFSCSMALSHEHPNGTLLFHVDSHSISCGKKN